MASNWIIFENQLSSLLLSKTVSSPSEFADKFSLILDNSIKFQSTTVFGNLVTSSNKDLVKNGIEFALKFGFKTEKFKTDLDKTLSEAQKYTSDINTLKIFLTKVPIPGFTSYINQYLDKIKTEPVETQITKIKEFIKKIKIEDLLWFFAATQIASYYLTLQFSQFPPVPPSITPAIGITIVTPGNILLLANGLKYAFKSKTPQEVALRCKLALELYSKTITGIYSGLTATGVPAVTPWIGIF
jgi:hypothetical protein